ncbi:hypothetical protein GZ77_03410 [Endozoicomonas montiporae]|uniref:MOSC domain-containing protein n=2 Tax=Endozoicomonas montiporae TaxID=1027273 RepID=A0A081NB22_9GAMM|nr:MOSC domain-containing protein [Endozoicomonas montiporae]AMO56648.1 hypothetical protein EZMO1_2572 [Endozoicomonas montiporae CL-33]KEQ15645.1 hypothetical protein GZ77_03410 [Endozoicomonas montiporae]
MTSDQSSLFVTDLAIYPVKSTRRLPVKQARIVSTGFDHDRRWMLVDSNGKFITQRQHPKMVHIVSVPDERGVLLSAPGMNDLQVTYPLVNQRSLVTVWSDECAAQDAGDQAAQWFSQYMGLDCRLVYMDEQCQRIVDQRYAASDDLTSFADGFPFLLTSEASLADLNGRLEEAVPMERFRPNIIINGLEAFAEDRWQRIRIGSVEFRVSKACTRCVMTTVDTQTGKKGKEPLKTLASFRKGEKGVLFGMNLNHNSEGVISVGDPVEILA